MNTIDVLHLIASQHSDLLSFSFHTFPRQQLLQDNQDDWTEIEKCHFSRALLIRKETGLPFWDSVMLSSFKNPKFSNILLSEALHHNAILDTIYVDKQNIYNIDTFIKTDERLACSSLVRMSNGEIKHLPMLDFHIPVSGSNFEVVKVVCKALKLDDGFILHSGESYHYIANFFVSWEELSIILARALLFCPIVDRAWISHQLQERCCSLRVDRKMGKETIFLTKI